jgi:hypothetical protein
LRIKEEGIAMGNIQAKSQRESLRKLYALVVEEMKAGADKSTISEKLVEMGMDMKDASRTVERMYVQLMQSVGEEQRAS